jgi:XTP/dITP diphosphohydrolase
MLSIRQLVHAGDIRLSSCRFRFPEIFRNFAFQYIGLMKLVFATSNPNKLKEIRALLGSSVSLTGLAELGCTEDIPETAPTLEGNALLKAQYVFNTYALNCFADDTGLEIKALGGKPGVLSARYSGLDKDAGANMDKVLRELKGVEQRDARFRTVIALLLNGKTYTFEGEVRGRILTERTGKDGFGYDPIFQPLEASKSFAEMSLEEKNRMSHRAIAVHKLVDFLNKLPAAPEP